MPSVKLSAFPDSHGSREKVDQHRVGVRFRKGGGITPNPERPAVQLKRGRLELLLNKDEVRLRRCGASHNEPFCDGSLKKAGFMSNLDEKPQEGQTPQCIGPTFSLMLVSTQTPARCPSRTREKMTGLCAPFAIESSRRSAVRAPTVNVIPVSVPLQPDHRADA